MFEHEDLNQRKLDALEASYAIIEFGIDGTIIRANALFQDLMGYSEAELIGRSHAMFVPRRDTKMAAYRFHWERLARGETISGEFRRVKKSGEICWIHGSYSPVRDANGKTERVLKVASNVTWKKRRDADFAGQIAAIRASQAVVEFDCDGNILYANRNYQNLTGYSISELKGTPHSRLCPPHMTATPDYRMFWDSLRSGSSASLLCERIGASGQTIWMLASYNPVRDENGGVKKIVKFAIDQTEAVLDHQRVRYMSQHDPLTHLYNRTGFDGLIEEALASASTGKRPALLLIDLDGFKQINDTYGHAAGDACLVTVASRLMRKAQHALGLARLGGDEFAVVFEAGHTQEAIEATAQDIITEVMIPFDWQGSLVRPGASIGIATGGTTASEIMRQADLALYKAKGAGRGQFRVYSVENETPEQELPLVGGASLAPHDMADLGAVPTIRQRTPLSSAS